MKIIKVEMSANDAFVPGHCSVCPFTLGLSARSSTYTKMTGGICALGKDSTHCPAVICDDSKRDN